MHYVKIPSTKKKWQKHRWSYKNEEDERFACKRWKNTEKLGKKKEDGHTNYIPVKLYNEKESCMRLKSSFEACKQKKNIRNN